MLAVYSLDMYDIFNLVVGGKSSLLSDRFDLRIDLFFIYDGGLRLVLSRAYGRFELAYGQILLLLR